MELIFTQVTEPNIFVPTGWNGTDISCKQRTGQRPLQLKKEITVTLPDKVDAKWYALLDGKLSGMNMQHVRHDIRLFDRTPFLQVGYTRMMRELGMEFNTLTVNPNITNFSHKLGRGIIEMKRLAKTYL